MNTSTTARLTRLGLTVAATTSAAVLTGLPPTGALALTSAVGAPAAAPGATASVNAFGLQITGTAAANRMVLSLPGARYVLTDAFPISAADGCRVIDVAGPRFGVSCRVTRNPLTGGLRGVTADAGAGDDTFRNDSPASIRLGGGLGDDVLRGGPAGDLLDDDLGANQLFGRGGGDTLSADFGTDTSPDEFHGGPGDDDIRAGGSDDLVLGEDGDDSLRGGLGADTLDGGNGTEDAVVYLDNAHDDVGVLASIDGVANDGTRGADERDNVLETVEELFGSHRDDILTGSNDDDRLEGNLGNDVLIGQRGADQLDGSVGNDTLASNQLFGVPVADGSIDVLDGNAGDGDLCRIPFEIVEDDATVSCEIIDED